MNNIKLEEYEEICPCCDGEKHFCNRCGGTGKIDWIDKLMGSRKSFDFDITNLSILNNKLYCGTPKGGLYQWNGVDDWIKKVIK